MIKIGAVIRILYQEYVAGFRGIIKAKEINKRWIVQLKDSYLKDKKEFFLLSLNESDFEVLKPNRYH